MIGPKTINALNHTSLHRFSPIVKAKGNDETRDCKMDRSFVTFTITH